MSVGLFSEESEVLEEPFDFAFEMNFKLFLQRPEVPGEIDLLCLLQELRAVGTKESAFLDSSDYFQISPVG